MTSLEALHNLAPVNIASLSFVYVLLPICLFIFYIAPKKLRPAVLLACSAGFYFLAEPAHLLLCIAVIAVNYLFVSAMVRLAYSKSSLLRASESSLAESGERNGNGDSPIVKPAISTSDLFRASESSLAENGERNGNGDSPIVKPAISTSDLFRASGSSLAENGERNGSGDSPIVKPAISTSDLFRASESSLAESGERNGSGDSPIVKPAISTSDLFRASESSLAESGERNGSGDSPPKLRRFLMILCIAVNLGAVGYFGIASQLADAAPPLGLLVICISGIDAVLEAYRENEPQTRNIIRFSLYLMFFPRLYAGPLTNPREFYAECGNAQYDTETVLIGFGRFAEGLLKYAAIGRSLFYLYESIRGIPAAEVSVLSAWLLIFSLAFALYFTLSGLSDIARGIAGMLGIKLPQNFYYPYQARSVTDFFERFNMTVTAFLKRTVLLPLSPAPEKPDSVADCINILLVGMLWGLWLGIRVSCFLWGIFIAVFLIMEKYLYPRVLSAVPTLFRRFYTFFAVLLSLAVFAGNTFAESLNHLAHMFGAGGIGLLNDRIMYILSMNWVLLVIAAVLSTNLVSLLISAARTTFPKVSLSCFAVMDILVLVLFTSLTLGGGVL